MRERVSSQDDLFKIDIYRVCLHSASGQSEELGQAKTSNGYTWRCSHFHILLDQPPGFPAGCRFLRHGSTLTSPTNLPEALWLKCMPRPVSVTPLTSPSSQPSQKISCQNHDVSLSWRSVGRQYFRRDTESCQTVFSSNLGNFEAGGELYVQSTEVWW